MSLVSGCCLKASLTFVATLELAEELELVVEPELDLDLGKVLDPVEEVLV